MMKKSYFYLLSFYIFWCVNSVYASSFFPAIEDSLENVLEIRRVAAFASDNAPLISTYSSAEPNRIIFVIKDQDYLNGQLQDIPSHLHISGKLPEEIIDYFSEEKLENIYRSLSLQLEDKIKTTEFVFTGHHYGGRLALVSSALWSQKYKEITGFPLEYNQLKVITFSSGDFGDIHFSHLLKDMLGEKNIIDFYPRFSLIKPISFGIPISFLPSEVLCDNFNKDSNFKCATFVGTEAFKFLIYGTLMSSGFGVNTGTSFFVHSLQALGGSYLLGSNIMEWYEKYRLLPTEDLVLEAFQYTQSNYKTNKEASLNDVGQPSLFSLRRGTGKSLGWLLGI